MILANKKFKGHIAQDEVIDAENITTSNNLRWHGCYHIMSEEYFFSFFLFWDLQVVTCFNVRSGDKHDVQ